jgi:hypothetical protein
MCERCQLLLEFGLRTVCHDLSLDGAEQLEVTPALANRYVRHGLRVLHWYEQYARQELSS